MQLIASKDAFFFKSGHSILKLCRKSEIFSTIQLNDFSPLEDFELIGKVFCFIGKIEFENSSNLLFVQECTEVTKIGNRSSSIWKIEKICCLPVNSPSFGKEPVESLKLPNASLRSNTKKNIAKFLINSKLNKSLSAQNNFIEDLATFINHSKSFYFSTDYDITRTLQSSVLNPEKHDINFFWNRNLLNNFFIDDVIVPVFKNWVVPMIYGHIDQKCIDMAGISIPVTLISRRSTKRAGLRYLKRGIDGNGDVANFVETELIISLYGHNLSYVQCRGSVPVFWSQKANYHLRPPLSIDLPLDQSISAFKTHIGKLQCNYGSPLILLNLVDQIGNESKLGESYIEHVNELNSEEVFYISFDFHRICGIRRNVEVTRLVDSLENQMQKIGFTWVDKTGTLAMKQNGVVRTNCVDCLDRTNVLQCSISHWVCLKKCRKLGLIEPLDKLPEMIENVLNTIWVEHGDAISKQYAGSKALKGDITRNANKGRRKFTGLLKDGCNSVTRYYMAHFSDFRKQAIIDSILGVKDDGSNASEANIELSVV